MNPTGETLNDIRQRELRSQGTINESEVAIKVGDLYVAQNVITGTRRPISIDQTVTETKQILRG
tara:strand:- start:93 stop:284 length:192 start_codon:yes stop_codon:yes gene_type:complete